MLSDRFAMGVAWFCRRMCLVWNRGLYWRTKRQADYLDGLKGWSNRIWFAALRSCKMENWNPARCCQNRHLEALITQEPLEGIWVWAYTLGNAWGTNMQNAHRILAQWRIVIVLTVLWWITQLARRAECEGQFSSETDTERLCADRTLLCGDADLVRAVQETLKRIKRGTCHCSDVLSGTR
jgi:hypothetical protein